MLLKLTEELPLNAPIDEVWKLLRDAPRLTSLLPGVENVTPLNEEGVEAYAASVSEKIGPFKIALSIEVRVTETVEPSLLKAAIKGADSMALNRITGSMQVDLSPASSGTQMHFGSVHRNLGQTCDARCCSHSAQNNASFRRVRSKHSGAICKGSGPQLKPAGKWSAREHWLRVERKTCKPRN